jgi:L,D-transpeptidase YbiS
MKRLLVNIAKQSAELFENGRLLRTYVISTAKNGIGSDAGSCCTPNGVLKVAEKIGAGMAIGSVFRGRKPTGQIWSRDVENSLHTSTDDLILSRILWLEGAETHNATTFERFIYIHGTNHEDKLGTPLSAGCIRMRNVDILDLFEIIDIGTEVVVS